MPESNHFVSSRYLLWEKPIAPPYFDIIHRDTSPGTVFDLAIELEDFTGSVYVKTVDIVEMGRTLGMMTEEEADKLRAENAELRRQINKLPKAQEELKSGLDDLTARFFANISTLDSEPVDSGNAESQDDRESTESEQPSFKSFGL